MLESRQAGIFVLVGQASVVLYVCSLAGADTVCVARSEVLPVVGVVVPGRAPQNFVEDLSALHSPQ